MKKSNIAIGMIALLFPLIVGMLSAYLTSKGMAVYGTMKKPPLSPPAWVFSVAWTILYLMMGLASYFIIVSDSPDKGMALLFYIIQLSMNFFWSILFFNMGMYMFAFLWLILMWAIVIVCTFRFWAINPLAGILMIPYIVWLTFAAYLNLGACVLALEKSVF